ncbi:MAG: hypothetical protein M0R80_08380 [Proteobacteria bacterium]|jgi:hypothetical protein|nr:hypothetical protein [Pseudomonadota bacterium]
MQVFLPYPDLEQSVCCLDPSRLGNQVYREAKTLITGGWPNHPASKMWSGYEPALAQYCLYGLEELASRGRYYPHWIEFYKKYLRSKIELPFWFGDVRLHSSHRSALLFKDFEWYGRFGWKEKPAILVNGKLPYYWTQL